MLNSRSKLILEVQSAAESAKGVDDMAKALLLAEKNTNLLNTRLKEQKLLLRELKEANKGSGGLSTDVTGKEKYIRDTERQLLQARSLTTEIRQQKNVLVDQAKHVDLMTGAWNKFEVVFRRVLSALASFVVINAALRLTTGFFDSLISSNQMLEVLNARLEALIPNSSKIKAIYAEIQRFTITTPFKVQEVVQAAVQLKAFGGDIIQNMRVIGDWASAVGKDLSDTATAFGKIIQSSPRTALLLSTRGLSKQAFDTYVAQYGDRALALNKLIDDTFGGTAERISQTFEGILSNISDLWTFISQRLGAGLFKELKGDLQTVYSILNNIRNSSDATIEGFSKFILYATGTAGLLLVVGMFSLIGYAIGRVIMLLESATIASRAFASATWIGALLTALGLVIFEAVKYKTALDDTADAENNLKRTSSLATQERISLLRQEISALERRNTNWKYFFDLFQGGSGVKWYQANTLYANSSKAMLDLEIGALKTQLEQEIKISQEKKNQLMILNSQVEGMDLYSTQLDVQKIGQQEFFKELAKTAKLQADVNLMFSPHTGVNNESQSAYYTAISTYFDAISNPANLERAIQTLRKLMRDAVAIGGSSQQDVDRMKTMTKELTSMMLELEKKGKIKAEKPGKGWIFTDWTEEIKGALDFKNAVGDLGFTLEKLKSSLLGTSNKPILESQLSDLKTTFLLTAGIINSYKIYSPSFIGPTNNEKNIKDVLILQKEQTKNLSDQIKILEELSKISTDFNEGLIRQLAEINIANQKIYDTLAGISVDFIRAAGKGILHEVLFGTTGKELDTQINDLRFQLIQVQGEAAGIKIIEDEQASLLAKINELEEKRANIVGTILMDALQKASDKLEDVAINLMLEPLLKSITNVKPVLDRLNIIEAEIATLKTSAATYTNFLEIQRLGTVNAILAAETAIAAIKSGGSVLDIYNNGIGYGDHYTPDVVPNYSLPSGPASSSNMSTLVRPMSGNSSTKNIRNIIISGPIYGYDDFRKKVADANRSNGRNIA